MTPSELKELGRLIRDSPALDVALKRHWIEILPHLKSADRDRLRAILSGLPTAAVPPAAPADTVPVSG